MSASEQAGCDNGQFENSGERLVASGEVFVSVSQLVLANSS